MFLSSCFVQHVLSALLANTMAKRLFRQGYPLAVPPLSLQEQFALRCADVSGLVAQQSTATVKAKAAFNALLAQAFS